MTCGPALSLTPSTERPRCRRTPAQTENGANPSKGSAASKNEDSDMSNILVGNGKPGKPVIHGLS
jgi:hypothetical protein